MQYLTIKNCILYISLLCVKKRKQNLFVPPRIVITKKCPRCQLRYRWKEKKCTHCTELTDHEVDALKERHREEHKGNAQLGRWFLFVAVILTICIALL